MENWRKFRMEEKFENWTEEMVEKFCDEFAIEDTDWVYNFVKNNKSKIKMIYEKNKEGDLQVTIKGVSN